MNIAANKSEEKFFGTNIIDKIEENKLYYRLRNGE